LREDQVEKLELHRGRTAALQKDKNDVEGGIVKTNGEIAEARDKILDAQDQKMKADSNLANLTENMESLSKEEKEELKNRDVLIEKSKDMDQQNEEALV